MCNFQPHYWQKDHYLKSHISLTVGEFVKGKIELLIDSFLKESQIKFYSLRFLWFQGRSLTCIFCLPWTPCFKLLYLHYKRKPIKTLTYIFIVHLFFMQSSLLYKYLSLTLVLSTNHKWSWKHDHFLVKWINTDKQKMPQVTVWILSRPEMLIQWTR